MIAKCGEERIWHWAHLGRHLCDPWWENETEWHRAWKGLFPRNWQERVQHADNGEKHIADVKTDHGWVIEFQHSHIKFEERRSRGDFYKKLVWVVDGTRRTRDGAQFARAWEDLGIAINKDGTVREIFPSECRLVRDWLVSDAPVLFDFGGEHLLWWLHAKSPDGKAYVAKFSRREFIDTQRSGGFDERVKGFGNLVTQYESNRREQEEMRAIYRADAFQQWLYQRRPRRRF